MGLTIQQRKYIGKILEAISHLSRLEFNSKPYQELDSRIAKSLNYVYDTVIDRSDNNEFRSEHGRLEVRYIIKDMINDVISRRVAA